GDRGADRGVAGDRLRRSGDPGRSTHCPPVASRGCPPRRLEEAVTNEEREALLAEVDRLDREATPGPWHHDPKALWACVTTKPGGLGAVLATTYNALDDQTADARLIAFARTALPALAAEVREMSDAYDELRSQLAMAKKLLAADDALRAELAA